jgi:hypothetical protein
VRLSWNVGKRLNRPGQTRREYVLSLTDKYGTVFYARKFSVTALRKLGDALQDALDGQYGQTHDWFAGPCRQYRKQLSVEKDRIKISAEPKELTRLIEEIDYLLGDI